MARGNPYDLQPFDPEIDRTFHRLVRHHFLPFEHPEHSVVANFFTSVLARNDVESADYYIGAG